MKSKVKNLVRADSYRDFDPRSGGRLLRRSNSVHSIKIVSFCCLLKNKKLYHRKYWIKFLVSFCSVNVWWNQIYKSLNVFGKYWLNSRLVFHMLFVLMETGSNSTLFCFKHNNSCFIKKQYKFIADKSWEKAEWLLKTNVCQDS